MKKKIKVFFVVVLIMFASLIPKVGASSIGQQFNGKFVYSFNTSNNYYVYMFPNENGMSPNVVGITNNDDLYTNFVTYLNGHLYYDGELLLENVKDYIICFKLSLSQQDAEDYSINFDLYTYSVKNNNGGWVSRTEQQQFPVFEFSASSNGFFLLFANSIIYLANYSGALTGVDAVARVFNGYLVTTDNSLGKYIKNEKSLEYEKGFNVGLNTQLSNQNWWVKLWDGVDAFLSIELLPNLTFGLLFSVPLVFGVLHLILFIWRSGD